MIKYLSKCCGADWRCPVTPDPTGEGRVICCNCQKYCLLEQVLDKEQSVCVNGCDGIKAVCSDCPTNGGGGGGRMIPKLPSFIEKLFVRESKICRGFYDHEPVWDGGGYSCWKCGLEFKSTGKYLKPTTNEKRGKS